MTTPQQQVTLRVNREQRRRLQKQTGSQVIRFHHRHKKGHVIAIWTFPPEIGVPLAKVLLACMAIGELLGKIWTFKPENVVWGLCKARDLAMIKKYVVQGLAVRRTNLTVVVNIFTKLVEFFGHPNSREIGMSEILDHLERKYGIPEDFVLSYQTSQFTFNHIALKEEVRRLGIIWQQFWAYTLNRHCIFCGLDLRTLAPITRRRDVINDQKCCLYTCCLPCQTKFLDGHGSNDVERECPKCGSVYSRSERFPNSFEVDMDRNDWSQAMTVNQIRSGNNRSSFANLVLARGGNVRIGSASHLRYIVSGEISYDG